MLIADDLDKLLHILPDFVKFPLNEHPQKKSLIEVVMDLGRRPEARFPSGPQYLSINNVSWSDLDFCIKKIPQFSGDNRSGIECTLHRISSIKNRKGNVIGLTFRVGRAVFGTISIIRDMLYAKKSILLLGKPGVGKTTAIREITRVLSDEMQKRVVIIDTSNEIAGDGDIPHPAIGRARRMQVARPELQHQVMIEAVENHMPEVIIIDEIGTELEAAAVCTIAERGVQLVGTAHGNYLYNLIKNPILSDLIGGIECVTLGDDEAKRRGTQKSILERKNVPAFHAAIEIHERSSWIMHENLDKTVDATLKGTLSSIQRRQINSDGSISIHSEVSKNSDLNLYEQSSVYYSGKVGSIQHNSLSTKEINFIKNSRTDRSKFRFSSKNFKSKSNFLRSKLYVYGINMQQVESCIKKMNLSLIITRNIFKADYILGLKSNIKYSTKIRQVAKMKRIIIYTIQGHTISSINKALNQINANQLIFLRTWYRLCKYQGVVELNAIMETRYAIEKVVIDLKESVELLSREDKVRNIQVKLINLYNLEYSISASNNLPKLVIYPS
uniref:AAA+ ATPase domain-containing protein n=1 Tax=Tolypiocladia glomerulata TaxID=860646 RepID=A0A1Z1MUL1_9FLOR|nr:hypothetical protein [Tolypiocladia glomerulata]ARW69768.1 hypothetical protein [Tolypiocladia glomerulata]